MLNRVPSDLGEDTAFPGRDLSMVGSIRAANIQTVGMVLRTLMFVVLTTRSIGDPIFDLSSADPGHSTIGIGAAVNVLVIVIAFLFVILRPSTAPLAVFGMWMPFLLTAFASTLYAPDFTSAARMSFVILSYWALFAVPFCMFRRSADLVSFVLLVFASSIGTSLYALWDLGHGLSDLAEFRLQSTFSHPNIYAFYLVLLLGLALYVRTSQATRWPPRVRWLITLYIPVLVIFLAFTKTRSAWGAGAVLYLVYAIRFDRRFLLGCVIAPILLSFNSSFSDRLTDVTEGTEIADFTKLDENHRLNSLAWREVLWDSALPSIVEKPMFGHGLESFRPTTPEFFPLIGPEGIDAHNFYLQVLFEMGLAGFIALVCLLAWLARWILIGWRYDPGGTVVISTILMAYLVESYTDNMIYYLSFNWYFWFVMGTICAWGEYQRAAQERRIR